MKHLLNLIFIVIFMYTSNAQSYEWGNAMYTADFNRCGANSALSKDGGIFVGGSFGRTGSWYNSDGTNISLSFSLTGAYPGIAVLAKYNEDGIVVWHREWFSSPSSNSFCSRVKEDGHGNVFVLVYYESNFDANPGTGVYNIAGDGYCLIKLDNNGNFIWARYLKSTSGNLAVKDLSIISDTLVQVVGAFKDSISGFEGSGFYSYPLTSNGNWDAFYYRILASGATQTGFNVGGSDNDAFFKVIADSLNNPYIIGCTQDTINLFGYSGPPVYVYSPPLNATASEADYFIVKYNSILQPTMVHNFGTKRTSIYSSGIYSAGSFSIAIQGNKIALGIVTSHLYDLLDINPSPSSSEVIDSSALVLWDLNFNYLWHRIICSGTTNTDLLIPRFSTNRNSLYLGGSFYQTIDLNPSPTESDIVTLTIPAAGAARKANFFSKFDLLGNYKWGRVIDGYEWDYIFGLEVDSAENVHIIGYSESGALDINPNEGIDSVTVSSFTTEKLCYLIKISECVSSTSSINVTRCDESYLTPSGKLLSVSGVYQDTVGNFKECDSIITINYTRAMRQLTLQNINSCGAYTWPVNGLDYAVSGIYEELLVSSFGCDSIVRLNLSIHQDQSVNQNVTACNSYSWSANDSVYETTGIYNAIIPSYFGCDSSITLFLTINEIDNGVSQTATDLTALQAGATYQWVDCNNAFAPISGETNRIYTPSASGNYAVIVNKSSCVDTSACLVFNLVGIHDPSSAVFIYPNPVSRELYLTGFTDVTRIEIYNALGVKVKSYNEFKQNIAMGDLPDGMYSIHIESLSASYLYKIAKAGTK